MWLSVLQKSSYNKLNQLNRDLEQRITERTTKLQASEEQFRLLFSKMTSGFLLNQMIYNDQGEAIDFKILEVNPSYEKIVGFKREDVIGKLVSELFPDTESYWLETFGEVGKTGIPKEFEQYTKVTNRHYQVSAYSPKQDQCAILFDDITKRKELEAQLRQTHKMESLGTLVGGIAHEFNNLLSPILGFTEMLMREKSQEDPDWKKLTQIQNVGIRAKELVKQMLAFGRKSLSQKTAVHLEGLIEDTIKLLKNTVPPNIGIQQDIEQNVPPVQGMDNELHQVLFNLCLNAAQAMPEGGDLTIRLKNKGFYQFINDEGKLQEGKFIALIVQDTGVGIEPSILARIYDPFFTTKVAGQGTGLGLSVVEGIVGQHEGHIEVESQVGTGTTFQVYLPIAQETMNPTFKTTEPLTEGHEHIMLIDDEPMILDVTMSMLEELGYQVTDYLDSVEALQWIKDHPHAVDLVMTDYGMPQMNGKELAEQLKAINPDIPIVLLTGYGDLVAKEDIHLWGMNDLLMKPFNLEELSNAVREILDKKETTR